MPDSAGEKFQKLVDLMARLRAPGGCPWDREQSFDTIKPYTLEETYEVLDAIDRRDWVELTAELGDLMLQVVFYAQMAAEERLFRIEDALDAINEKLVRRHPHVFGDEHAASGDRGLDRFVRRACRAGVHARLDELAAGDGPCADFSGKVLATSRPVDAAA